MSQRIIKTPISNKENDMKLTIGVMFGAESVEHEISIISAIQAMEAINKDTYEVLPIYISKEKHMYSGSELRELSCYKDIPRLLKSVTPIQLVRINNQVVCRSIKPNLFFKSKNIDLMIPIVHGSNSEDGTVVGFCKMLGVPYVGSDVIAAAVGQDKIFFKHILENSTLPVVPWFWFYGKNFEKNKEGILDKAKDLGYPLVIKPATLGSSIGIMIANDEKSCVQGIEAAMMYDRKILVEKKIESMQEINCSVLDEKGTYRASPLEEVLKSDEILSYQDKYEGGDKSKGMVSTTRMVPAKISEELTKKIQNLALQTSEVIGVSGVVRIDFLYDANKDVVYVNEINTIPGSLSFYLWKEDGIEFDRLMDILIESAIVRLRDQERMIYSYDTNLLSNFKKGGSK
jgi:D-alanine-D-alanine ligase